MIAFDREFELHTGTHRERLLSRLSHSLNEFGVAQDPEAKKLCLENYRDSLKFLRKRLTTSGLQIREWNLFGSMAPVLRLPLLAPVLLNRSKARLGVYPLNYSVEDVLDNVTKNHGSRSLPSDVDLILNADSKKIAPRDISYIKYFARKKTFDEYGVFIQFR